MDYYEPLSHCIPLASEFSALFGFDYIDDGLDTLSITSPRAF